MEVLIVFVFPLLVYIGLKIAIFRDKDLTEIDLKKFAEGIRLFEFKFYEEAIAYFDIEIAKNNKSMVCYAYRAHCHLAIKNYYQAIYNYDKALAISHDLHEVFLKKAIALFQIADYEMALKEINKAIWYYKEQNMEAFEIKIKMLKALGKISEIEKCEEKIQNLKAKNNLKPLSKKPHANLSHID